MISRGAIRLGIDLCLAVLMIAFAIGCSASGSEMGDTIHIAVAAEPSTLDYICTGAYSSHTIGNHVFEGLFTFDDNYALIPELADTWSASEDSTIWVVRIREGVLFHNGREVTSDDVKASFRRALEGAYRKNDFAALESVDVVDRYTVRFKLSASTPIFSEVTAVEPRVPIMPVEIIGDCPPCLGEGSALAITELIGTGPYRFVESKAGDYVLLERFADYVADDRYTGPTGFGGKRTAMLQKIYFHFVPEAGARLAGLQTGKYDIAMDLPGTMMTDLDRDPSIRAHIIPDSWVDLIWPNTGKFPFSNVTFRKGVALGIDSAEILSFASLDPRLGSLDPSIFFEDQVWHNDRGKELYNVGDVQRAKDLIAASGYAGEEIVIMTNPDYGWMYRTSIALHQQLAERLGLNAKLEVYDWPTQVSFLAPDKWDEWDLWQSGCSLRLDPSMWNGLLMCDTWGPHCNEGLDALLVAGMGTADFQSRYEIYSQVQQYMYEEDAWPLIFGHLKELYGVSEKVKGRLSTYGPLCWDLWIEE